MWMPIVLAGLILAAWFACLGLRAGAAEPRGRGRAAVAGAALPAEAVSRSELRLRLEALAASPPPNVEQSPGAMCYKPAMPSTVAEYTCPACGEKTLYDRYMPAVTKDIPACRRLLPALEGLRLRLDESEFCRTCSPAVDNPRLVLVVDYGNGKLHRCVGITTEDMGLVREFLEGSPTHAGLNDSVTHLRNHVPRLRELLGIPAAGAGGGEPEGQP